MTKQTQRTRTHGGARWRVGVLAELVVDGAAVERRGRRASGRTAVAVIPVAKKRVVARDGVVAVAVAQ